MLRFHFSYVSLIANIKTLSHHLAVSFDLSKIPDTGEKQLCFHAMSMLMGVGRIALFLISSAKRMQVTCTLNFASVEYLPAEFCTCALSGLGVVCNLPGDLEEGKPPQLGKLPVLFAGRAK